MAALLLSIGLGVAFALALRLVRLHRALGAVLAGVFAGALVALTLDPPPESAVLDARETAYLQELRALEETGVSEAAVEDHRRRHEPLVQQARDDLAHALASRRTHPAIGALALAGVLLASLGTRAGRRRPAPLPIVTGALQVVFGVLPGAILAMWLLPVDRTEALLIGCLVGSFNVMTHMPVEWIGAAGRAPFVHLASLAGVAVLLAIVAIEPSWWTGGALVAWGAGWGLGRFRFPRRWTRPLLLFVIVPSIVAWLVAHAESATLDWKITLFVVMPLLTAAEGHALGLWLGIQIFAPDRVRHDAMDHAVEAQTSGVALSRILLVTLVLMTMQDEVVRTALVGIMITEAIGVAIPLPGWRPRST